jgi:hypothetical protein
VLRCTHHSRSGFGWRPSGRGPCRALFHVPAIFARSRAAAPAKRDELDLPPPLCPLERPHAGPAHSSDVLPGQEGKVLDVRGAVLKLRHERLLANAKTLLEYANPIQMVDSKLYNMADLC